MYKSKKEYFSHLANKRLAEMKFLIRHGKLTQRSARGARLAPNDPANWFNVLEHCLVEAAVAEALAELLGLSPEEKEKLSKAASIHDWDKRLERRPQDFTDEEKGQARAALQRINADPEIIFATSAEFLNVWLENKPRSLLQKLIRYIDDICEGSRIMPLGPRLAQAAARHKDLVADPVWAEKVRHKLASLGKLGVGKEERSINFYDGQCAMEEETQTEIFDLLKARGHQLSSPDDIPEFLQKQIEKNYVSK